MNLIHFLKPQPLILIFFFETRPNFVAMAGLQLLSSTSLLAQAPK